MKRLFYVRHGETEMNQQLLFSGQVETPLTDRGQSQAKAAGQHVQANLPKIDLIICSSIGRAYHTASIIAEEIGYPIEKIQKSDLLIERSYGKLEGTSSDKWFDHNTFEELETIHEAETVAQLGARADAALKYVTSLPEDTILVVGHGTFGRAFRRAVDNRPHHLEYTQEHRDNYRMGNAEITELI